LALLLPLALIAVLVVALLALGASMVLTILVAALAALWTAGIAGYLGRPVTPATLVVLPVVLGLSADYLIQSANRVMESAGSMEERLTLAARRILPTTGLAAAATAAGMLAFVASGIPLVRQFGLFMALGVLLAYLANYLVGLPLLLLLGRRFPRVFDGGGFRAAAGRRLARIGTLAPAAALAIVVIGLAGWAALPSIKIETDPAQLVPANDPALAQAASVRKEIGLTGEIGLLVQGPDPATPEAVKWLDQASRQAAAQSGGDLKQVESLPGLLAGFNQGTLPDPEHAALMLAYRRLRPAILAILPTVVAAGAATGLLFLVDGAFGLRSSPITILLGGVVIAFATEFGVLWLARYRREHADGLDPTDAAARA